MATADAAEVANLKFQLEYEREQKLLAAQIGMDLLNQNKALTLRNSLLHETVERLESDLKAAYTTNEQQQQKIAALRRIHSESEDQTYEYCDETERELKSEVKEMKRMLKSTLEQMTNTAEELSGMQMMYEEREQSISRLSQELKTAKDQVRKSQKKQRQLLRDTETLSQHNAKLRKLVDSSSQQKSQVLQLKREKRTLVKENRQLRFSTPACTDLASIDNCANFKNHENRIFTSTPARPSVEMDCPQKISFTPPTSAGCASVSIPWEYCEDMEKMKELIRDLRLEMARLKEAAAEREARNFEVSLAQELKSQARDHS